MSRRRQTSLIRKKDFIGCNTKVAGHALLAEKLPGTVVGMQNAGNAIGETDSTPENKRNYMFVYRDCKLQLKMLIDN